MLISLHHIVLARPSKELSILLLHYCWNTQPAFSMFCAFRWKWCLFSKLKQKMILFCTLLSCAYCFHCFCPLPNQKSWLKLSGGLLHCRMNYSPLWTPRGRAGQMGVAWGGGGQYLLCPSRNDANTETSRTCSWPSLSSTSVSYCCRTTRWTIVYW